MISSYLDLRLLVLYLSRLKYLIGMSIRNLNGMRIVKHITWEKGIDFQAIPIRVKSHRHLSQIEKILVVYPRTQSLALLQMSLCWLVSQA